jgi:hypothetical protein
MKIRLNLIESRLRILIEEWMVPFNSEGFQQKLAHQLVESMLEHIHTDGNGQSIAPYQYTIQLHPEIVDELRGTEIMTRLPQALEEAARSGGMVFLRRPVLRFEPKPAFEHEEIAVHAQTEQSTLGNTAALSLKKVTEISEEARNLSVSAFLIMKDDKIFPLNRPVTNMGRRNDNQLVVDDPRVSRVHAQIRLSRGKFVIFDLNSSGGTSVNGQRVHQHALKPGDVISLAGISLIYGEEPKKEDGVSDTTRVPVPDPPPFDLGE